jgi:hypothetical protein
MNDAVKQALEDFRAEFPESKLNMQEDAEGGAWVIVEDVEVGDIYNPRTTWIGFRITFQYPYADVYPHFMRSDMQRSDGRPLGDGMTSGHSFLGRSAIQISRRSNHLNPMTDTAFLKLLKVLQWLKTRP